MGFYSTQDLFTDQTIIKSTNSSSIGIHHSDNICAQFSYTVTTPAAVDFDAGTNEVDTITFPAKAGATNGDYISITDTNGDKWGIALSTAGIAEVTSITAIGEGSVAEKTQIVAIAEGSVKNVTQVTTVADITASLAGTYFKVYDAAGSVGIWFSIGGVPGSAPSTFDRAVEVAIAANDTAAQVAGKITTAFGADAGLVVGNVQEVVTITDVAYGARTAASDGSAGDATGFTIATTAAGVDSALHLKYFILKDEVGTVGFWFDVDNAGGSAPTTGADRDVEITGVNSAMTIGQVGTVVYDAIHADSKFNGVSNDTAGTIVVVSTTYGNKTGQSAGDSGFTVTEHTAGASSALNGKYFVLADVDGTVAFWFDVGNVGTAEPSHGATRAVEITTIAVTDNAATVAGKVRTAIDADSKFDVGTLTDATFNAICKDLKSVTNSSAGDSGFTVATVTNGSDTTSPTGAIWSSIAAGKKAVCDIVGATDANSVAVIARAALAGLTGIATVITVGNVSTADVPITHVVRAPVADPVPKNADDSGAGSITVAETNEGVVSTIDADANTVTVAAHGLTTGVKGQLTVTGGGSLPTGLSTSTDYWIIVVDANTFKFAATSVDNAVAGTAVNITSQGTTANTFTFTPTAIAGGVVHLEGSLDNATWFDIASKTANITATGSTYFELANAGYMYVRANVVLTAGLMSISGKLSQKGCGC